MRELTLKALLLALLLSVPAAVVFVRSAGQPAAGESAPAPGPETGDGEGERSPTETAVLSVIQGLFDVIASRDTTELAALMAPEGRLVRITVAPGEADRLEVTSRAEFARSLTGGEAHFLERVWDARVLVDGPLATVWAPYDFHVNTEFSHCGTDVFELVRSEAEWRIVSVTYTRRPSGPCPESPLGPP